MPYCLQCGNQAELKIPAGDNRERIVCNNCGYIHYENPKLICGALVTHKNKILLCKRAIEPQYGLWTLPAGFMEIGETVEQGAMRETMEEADATAQNMQLYCIYDIPAIGQVYMMYMADLVDGKFGAGEESLECQLFDEADIPWETLAFESVTRTLKHFFEDRKKYTNRSDYPQHHEKIKKDFD